MGFKGKDVLEKCCRRARMLLFLKILSVKRVYKRICNYWSRSFLEILNDSVCLERVCYGSAEFVLDACTYSVRGHKGDIHFHFVLGVAISMTY